jgi:hypothetical protein
MQATIVRERESGPSTTLRLENRLDGQLWALRGETECAVRVRRAFPWSAPGRFISLRDAGDGEFALVAEPDELDPESRRSLETALVAAGFVFAAGSRAEVDDVGHPCPPSSDDVDWAGKGG